MGTDIERDERSPLGPAIAVEMEVRTSALLSACIYWIYEDFLELVASGAVGVCPHAVIPRVSRKTRQAF